MPEETAEKPFFKILDQQEDQQHRDIAKSVTAAVGEEVTNTKSAINEVPLIGDRFEALGEQAKPGSIAKESEEKLPAELEDLNVSKGVIQQEYERRMKGTGSASAAAFSAVRELKKVA